LNKWTQKLTRPGFRHTAIALYVVCLVGLIVGFVSVSLLQVEHAAYIQASPTLEKGRPNAMRGVVLHAPTGRFMTRASIEVELADGTYEGEESLEALWLGRTESIAQGQTERSGHMHLTADVPEGWEAGDYALVMQADGQAVENFRTGAPVAVAERSVDKAYWPERIDRLPKDDRSRESAVVESEGPVKIDLLPLDGRVSRGLKGELFLRTTNRETGEPISTPVDFSKVEGLGTDGLPDSVQTDELGLARIELTAITDQTWTLHSSAADHLENHPDEASAYDDLKNRSNRAKLHVTTVPTQVSLEMSDVVAVAGESADGVVSSLFKSGGLMVDLYNGDDWVQAAAFGIRPDQSGIRVRVPSIERRGPLYRVQVYKNFFDQGGAWDVEYLVAADGHSLADYQQAAQTLAAHIADQMDDPYFARLAASDTFAMATDKAKLRRWIEAMLEAVPRHFDAPPILINSQKADRDKLDKWKKDVKADLIALTAIALLIGLAVLGWLVTLGIQSYRHQNRMLRDVEFEMSLDAHGETTSDEEALALDKSISEGNFVAGLQIFIVVATLVLFTLGILLLLSYL
jgi:hypothetical protein